MTIMQAIREQLEFRRVRGELRHFKGMYALPIEDVALNMLARCICSHKSEPVKAIIDLSTGTDHGYGYRQPSHWVRANVLYHNGQEHPYVTRCYIGAHELQGAPA